MTARASAQACTREAQAAILQEVEAGRWCILQEHFGQDQIHTYTVGLQHLGLPEIIVCGVPDRMATHMINATAQQMVSGACSPCHGSLVPGVFNIPPMLVAVDRRNKYLFTQEAFEHYKHWEYGLLQIVVPDSRGRFPWVEDFNPRLAEIQPLLGAYRPALN